MQTVRRDWSMQEDNELYRLVMQLGNQWRQISYRMNRSEDALRNRWNRFFVDEERRSKAAPPKRRQWTKEEDAKLLAYERSGQNMYNWIKTHKHEFGGRSRQAIRNRLCRIALAQERAKIFDACGEEFGSETGRDGFELGNCLPN